MVLGDPVKFSWSLHARRIAAPRLNTSALGAWRHREGRFTIEETRAAFERTAREMGENATLSTRQLGRWMDGVVGRPRAVSIRVAERFWGFPFETLIGPPAVPAARLASFADSASRALALPVHDHLRSRDVPHIARGDPEPEGSGVDRRAFIASALTVGMTGAIPAALLESSYRAVSTDDWLAAAFEYGHAYPVRPKADLLVDLGHDLAVLVGVIDETPDGPRRRDLREAAGRIAGLLGMACTDTGHAREARLAWLLARRHADAGGSAELRLWVRGQEAIAGFYAGRSPTVILALTEEALATVKGAERTVGYGHLLGARAQALAITGDLHGAVASLDAMATTRPTGTGNAPSFSWGDHRVLHSRSFVYSTAGSLSDALREQDLALGEYRPDQGLGRAQVHMHRALSVLRGGDVQAGIDYAANVLHMARPGRYLLAVADLVVEFVPATHLREPVVREFAELLAGMRARQA